MIVINGVVDSNFDDAVDGEYGDDGVDDNSDGDVLVGYDYDDDGESVDNIGENILWYIVYVYTKAIAYIIIYTYLLTFVSLARWLKLFLQDFKAKDLHNMCLPSLKVQRLGCATINFFLHFRKSHLSGILLHCCLEVGYICAFCLKY
jgi:hypothetical protein